MADEVLKRTPLYATHLAYGGKIVPFAGWELPIQYEAGVIKEHMAVRTACGLFDVSHMGEITLTGPDALNNLNWLLTNDFTDMKAGEARYSPMCNEEGGCVDDLIVYKKGEDDYWLVVNAGNKDKDFAWMQAHKQGEAEFRDISDSIAQLALQGPQARAILKKLTDERHIPTAYYACTFEAEVAGTPAMISTTGYTGEDGVEIYITADKAPELFEKIMEAGREEGLLPCGLGARDTLRLEAGMPLYGHEMNEEITPVEAGLGMFVKMDKEDFVGRQALAEKGTPTRRKVGLKVTGRGIVREEQDVYVGEEKIGRTTSGTHCPYLGGAYANAIIDTKYKDLGTVVEVDVRGRRIPCEVVRGQYYVRKK